MIKVYQTIVDRGHGNCMQAAIASLLELPLEEVPHFLEHGCDWFEVFYNYLKEHGYNYKGMLHNYNQYRIINKRKNVPTAKVRGNMGRVKKYEGVNGYFFASVYSPKYYDPNDSPSTTHAVIVDRNFNIVHDVNPTNKNLKEYPEAKKLKYNGLLNIYLIERISE